MADEDSSIRQRAGGAGGVDWVGRVARVRRWVEGTLLWRVWERLREIEVVDRSVALAGKAFVSFFPLVIVVAAFLPRRLQTSTLTTLTNRLGIRGHALESVRSAFASSEDIRRATGVLGLVLTFFFATSFTTALQRVYLRAWRRSPGRQVSEYVRGPLWLVAVLGFTSALGEVRALLGDGLGLGLFVLISLAATSAMWWFTAWYMLGGHVRWRVLVPTGLVTGLAMWVYAVSASIWMPKVVTSNETQFGFFGVALALVTWCSGAAICILVGACAGQVLAEDDGPLGALVRGPRGGLLVHHSKDPKDPKDAPPTSPAPPPPAPTPPHR
jgi:membrane protein